MAKANQHAKYFFTQGNVVKQITYKGEKLTVTLNIPTNYQNDQFMTEFTDMRGSGEIAAAELIEARLIRNIVELPFEVPRTFDLNGDYVNWSDATDNEKCSAVAIMDPTLREEINNAIIGEANISGDEQENCA